MDSMSGRTAATLLGVLGAVALGLLIKWRSVHKDNSVHATGHVDIDDDLAAEIIKRAKPQFERARDLYAY